MTRRRKIPETIRQQWGPSLHLWNAVPVAHPVVWDVVTRAQTLHARSAEDARAQATIDYAIEQAAAALLTDARIAHVFGPRAVRALLRWEITGQFEETRLLHLEPNGQATLQMSGDPPVVALVGPIPVDQVDPVVEYARWQQARLRGQDLVEVGGHPPDKPNTLTGNAEDDLTRARQWCAWRREGFAWKQIAARAGWDWRTVKRWVLWLKRQEGGT